MEYRSSNPKIYTFPSAKRRSLSSLVIFSPVYWIISVPCWISCPANSPSLAIREVPTRTRIFTSGCLLVCADVLPVLLSLDSSAPNIEAPTGPCTAFPGGVDHGGYRVGWLRSQAHIQPPHAPLASDLGILLLSLPAHSG